MIKIRNLNKSYKNKDKTITALNNISLNIQKGEIFGIIGYSGAGKSTLLRCINKLEQPDRGNVFIDGIDITKLSDKRLREERKNIGMIFQHFNLLEQSNVYENIAFPLKINGYNKNQIENRVNSLLKYVDLIDKKYNYPSQLSGGEKQRVAIARAISVEPKVLLSDEGTSALDPQTTETILDLLKKINRELGITIVMVTHQMEVVKNICDSVAIMENGKIIEKSSVETLFTSPKTKTANLFINSLKGDVEEEIIDLKKYHGTILRLGFLGENANKPIISKLSKKWNIDINILSGNINKLHEKNIGHLILEFLGDESSINSAIKDLEEDNIIVEVIK